jgi:membrane-associated phospholipid phosphatase
VPLRSLGRRSFPSGDGAQAGALCAAAYIFGDVPPVLCALAAGLAVFGRIYFGCHWALDASAGALQGLTCTLMLHRLAPIDATLWQWGWGDGALGGWRLVIAVVLSQLAGLARKKLLPAALGSSSASKKAH